MALSISGNLIIDREFRTPSTGSADNEVTTLSADATLLAFLNGLNSSPDTGFPQYAERDDTASGATLALVADTAGTPFPTSGVGISTGFSDIDGDSISLFAADASHPNVVGADRTFRLSKPLIDIEADAELAASKSAKAGARLVIGTRHEITAAGIETVLHTAGHTVAARSSCEADLVRALDAYRPDIIILAESIVW